MIILQLIVVILLIVNSHSVSIENRKNGTNLESKPTNSSEDRPSGRSNPSLATVVVNSQVLTIVNYQGSQIYVYSAIANENEFRQTPQKWVFYFVPIMMPVVSNDQLDSWVFVLRTEIRIRLMLSSKDVEELVRNAIMKKFDSTVSQYSRFWDVAPLMIDSLMAYIVRGANLPVEGVHPYKAVHPNQLTMIFRFRCSTQEIAEEIVKKIIEDEYEIEISFYFAGFKQVSMNLVSISSDQLRSVLSKTVADGGSTNAQYIHRQQTSTFVGRYLTNVRKMIYMENEKANMSMLTTSLEDQFSSLMEQAMTSTKEVKLDLKLYEQVWSSNDFNPDKITNTINKLFIFNKTATEHSKYTDTFFNLNQKNDQASSTSASVAGGFSIFGIGGSIQGSGSSSSSSSNALSNTRKDIYSSKDVQDLLAKEKIESEWTGEKWVPKSLYVYRITDVADYLQVGIIAKQLVADKQNGAIIRTVSTNIKGLTASNATLPSFMVGEIRLFGGRLTALTASWLICDGSQISRNTYSRLYDAIGNLYGDTGNGATFMLPDFRGRVPVGVDPSRMRVSGAITIGLVGGHATYQLKIDQLPSHNHGAGSLATSTAGAHSHTITDPGHNHGGHTQAATSMSTSGGHRDSVLQLKHHNDYTVRVDSPHAHAIPIGHTGISVDRAENHAHSISGQTTSVGTGDPISNMPPFQTVHYIIFAGEL